MLPPWHTFTCPPRGSWELASEVVLGEGRLGSGEFSAFSKSALSPGNSQLPGEEVNVEGRLPGQEEWRGGKEGAGHSLVLEGLFNTEDPCMCVLSLLQVGHTTV